jgi:hypothetical protein
MGVAWAKMTEAQRQRHREYVRQWYWRDPESARERHRQRQAEPGAHVRAAEWDRIRGAERRLLLGFYKMIVGCTDCGEHFEGRPECLDFDHKPGTEKIYGLANMQRRSLAAIIVEIEKCDVVCSNCHRTRTKNRREKE